MEDFLIDFLLELNQKGLINNHDFSYEDVARDFANKYENKQLIIYNVSGSLPLIEEFNKEMRAAEERADRVEVFSQRRFYQGEARAWKYAAKKLKRFLRGNDR